MEGAGTQRLQGRDAFTGKDFYRGRAQEPLPPRSRGPKTRKPAGRERVRSAGPKTHLRSKCREHQRSGPAIQAAVAPCVDGVCTLALHLYSV